MSETYFYIKVNGDTSLVDIEHSEFNDQVHKLLECSIYELVHLPGDFYMVVDENGKIYEKPKEVNLKASLLYPGFPQDPIVGDVLIGKLGMVHGEPDMVGLDVEEISRIERLFSLLAKGNTFNIIE